MEDRELKVFGGNSNPSLSAAICKELKIPMGKSVSKKFSDGETWVEVAENVRGRDVFVIQSTSSPANDHLMELLITIDALRRASADRITAVIPYYGYARQDRKVAPRTPITSKLVADLVVAAGAHRVLSMDLHAAQIQGFFNIPFDHLYAAPVLLDWARSLNRDNMVVVSPDAGGVERARAYAKRLNASLAIIDKRRVQANVSQVMNVIGEVTDASVVIVDDMVDTAGTLTQAANVLLDRGAKEVFALATHPVLSGPAVERIQASGISALGFTDTIALSDEAAACEKIQQCSVAKLLAEGIWRIHSNDSVSSLFV